jgi:hypothetical protein
MSKRLALHQVDFSIVRHLAVVMMLYLVAMIGAAFPLIAQDDPVDPSGGLDPVTTPQPLPTREPRPAVFASASDDRAQLQTFFQGAIPQGETRLVRVMGNEIESVSAIWQGRLLEFLRHRQRRGQRVVRLDRDGHGRRHRTR